jgi:hypothetical protein
MVVSGELCNLNGLIQGDVPKHLSRDRSGSHQIRAVDNDIIGRDTRQIRADQSP